MQRMLKLFMHKKLLYFVTTSAERLSLLNEQSFLTVLEVPGITGQWELGLSEKVFACKLSLGS